MAKYEGSIELIAGLVQAHGSDFPLVDASAVQADDSGKRLNEVLSDMAEAITSSNEAVQDMHDAVATVSNTVERVDTLTDASQKANEDILSLKESTSTITAEVEELTDNINSLQEIATEVQTAIESVNDSIESLETQVDIKAPQIVIPDSTTLVPDKYYVFGLVSKLDVTLQDVDDGYAHEYIFEFTAGEPFAGLSISPEPRWANTAVFEPNKTYQISILRGIGVIVGA
jgi:archaellum component FlaC